MDSLFVLCPQIYQMMSDNAEESDNRHANDL
ncbi:Hypothetical protein TPAS_831 [Trichococcus pasteurii]|uniref:Uncharacterized protein n=1 Tax=Trichococcus pasteurii TaxID=43064 RepID=A0A1W1IDS2_9LACT|nr:Hypothetical protein TPAS_831 [Trichococcus pasteurii]SSB92037.1 Hypothetical protein TPAS_831 [Trichococcus pasteurii]